MDDLDRQFEEEKRRVIAQAEQKLRDQVHVEGEKFILSPPTQAALAQGVVDAHPEAKVYRPTVAATSQGVAPPGTRFVRYVDGVPGAPDAAIKLK